VALFSKYSRNKRVIKKLKSIIQTSDAKNILLYLLNSFIKSVVSTSISSGRYNKIFFASLICIILFNFLINELRREKKIVYVPFMEDDSFKIVKYRLPLHKKKFNIKEPTNSFLKPNKIDLAVVPIVGIDALNKRIGFGKGMYDRFFYRLKYRPKIVFIQLELCKSKEILSDNYDIEADYIITG
jgi:5-formyltetrahydrofolate cyclo-ligase